jgi:hypothetical protein
VEIKCANNKQANKQIDQNTSINQSNKPRGLVGGGGKQNFCSLELYQIACFSFGKA